MKRKLVLDLSSSFTKTDHGSIGHSNLSSHSTQVSSTSSFGGFYDRQRDSRPDKEFSLTRTGTSKAVEINRVRRHLSPRVNLSSSRRLRREIAEATDIALDVVRRAERRQTQTLSTTGSVGPPLSSTQSMHKPSSTGVAECQSIRPPNYPNDQYPESPKLNETPKKRDIGQFLLKSQKYGPRVVGLFSSTVSPSKSFQSQQTDLDAKGGLHRSQVKSFPSAVSSSAQETSSKYPTKTVKAVPKPSYSSSIRPTAKASERTLRRPGKSDIESSWTVTLH
jgi:hypothetical protein